MNVQAHMSGQTSGRVTNQSGLPQQNVDAQVPNFAPGTGGGGGGVPVGGPQNNLLNMDPEIIRARQGIREEIFAMFERRWPQPPNEAQRLSIIDFGKRVEERLFKIALTKEEYLNLRTLESRVAALIKRSYASSHNQRYPQLVNSSHSSIDARIPTPGILPAGNSNLTVSSAVDTSMISASVTDSMPPTAVNAGSMLPNGGMHGSLFNRSDGFLANGYQQLPDNFSMGSEGNTSSMDLQRMESQMIPTHSYVNMESSNNYGGFSTVESAMLTHQQHQKQYPGCQNSRILRDHGSQIDSGIRSGLQQKPYGLLIGGPWIKGGNMQLSIESEMSEGCLAATPFANSPKTLQHQFDHQQAVMQGDGYRKSNADSFGSGNFYGAVASIGSIMNGQNLGSMSMSKINPSMMSNLSNLHSAQQPLPVKREHIDQSKKMSFESSSLLQSNQHDQLKQMPHQFQQQQQLVQQQQQRRQKQQNQQLQHLLNDDAYNQSQLQPNFSSQVKHKPGVEHQLGSLQSQSSESLQLYTLQSQFQQYSAEDCLGGPQQFSAPSGKHDLHSSILQSYHQKQQMLYPHQFVSVSQTGFRSLPVVSQSDSLLQGQWNTPSLDRSNVPGNMSHDQHVQEDFRQRISSRDEAQYNNLCSEGSAIGQNVSSGTTAMPPNSGGATFRISNAKDCRFRNQQRWLLFLQHARRCAVSQGKCMEFHCSIVQKLLRHMEKCNSPQCTHPRCHHTKTLIQHHKHCRDPVCPVCVPVKNYIQTQFKARAIPGTDSNNPSSNGFARSYDPGDISARPILQTPSNIDKSEDHQPSSKRMKSQSLISESEKPVVLDPAISEPHPSQELQCQDYQDDDVPDKSELMEAKMELHVSSSQGSPHISEITKESAPDIGNKRLDSQPVVFDELTGVANKQESIKVEKETEQPKQENATSPAENAAGTKSGKPRIKGVSLMELFTPEQVREHITGLRQWVGQGKARAEKNQAMEHSMSENSCQLCAVDKLSFEPPPIYCTLCGARTKRNAMYYTMGAGDTRHYFCIPCYNEARGDAIVVDRTAIPKAKLEKKKNDEVTEEWWVQCDKCEAWQHQICALFNGRRNDGGQAEYTCPNCYIAEVEREERKPLPQSAVLGAKDLPRTTLSDQIEQRLFRRLKQERQERARREGKNFDEVIGAEALVVRVVSSVDKKLEVKQRFLEIFQEKNCPTEFPYKSKVILLFQKIEGVEVCLFGMYVQEFGSECAFPNQRRVYLSYLDSVKYFRPEIKAVTGEALRTFVYHEILIGYLEYCKKRGFTSCYIWACPPLKGEDYILYCHPEIQKTPKSDKLREWYLAMLRKAGEENIVVDLTNLYDHFFVSTGECKAKVTAARLPYFDGDYWPGAAEDLIYQMHQEEDGRKQNERRMTKKTITKRALRALGQTDLSGNVSKDLLLMHRLGETIFPMKEDFIMVHLQHCCNHCCLLMVSGTRWVCNQCKNFQICEKCYDAEQGREERERHPVNQREKHALYPVEITDVPADTKDKDEILESEFFDTRQAFLSLCQGNHYQYDTLRQAKHSSMMVLYHLHNPTAPAFMTTCNSCHLDIETGQGWHCNICPDYDVCNACYQKDGGIDHPHRLINHPSIAERDAQNKEARQMRVVQLRKMLDLLVHASHCRSLNCQYPNCRKVKGLFRHGIQCRTRASGGCVLCKKMWYLLQLHSRACKESECRVPRCRDLKDHLRRLQQQSDSRRRAAVMEMMRQRAAEVANSG